MKNQLPALIAGVLVLLLGALGYQLIFSSGESVTLELLEASGEVRRVDANGAASEALVGDQVRAAERLQVGANGRAVLGVGEGSRLTLEARSAIRVTQVEATGVRVELEQGRVQAKVSQGSTLLGIRRGERSVEIESGAVALRAEEDGVLRVETESGIARLEGFGGLGELGEGERLSVGVDGEQVHETVPAELLLHVAWPEAVATREEEYLVGGTAGAFSSVQVLARSGTKRVRADAEGRFEVAVVLMEGENEVEVVAVDGFGGERRARHTVQRDTQAPQAIRAEVVWGP